MTKITHIESTRKIKVCIDATLSYNEAKELLLELRRTIPRDVKIRERQFDDVSELVAKEFAVDMEYLLTHRQCSRMRCMLGNILKDKYMHTTYNIATMIGKSQPNMWVNMGKHLDYLFDDSDYKKKFKIIMEKLALLEN